MLAVLGALIPYTFTSAGCALKTHFPDMRRQLDALPMPDGYELLAETDSGSKPFGPSPTVRRIYRSPQDPKVTCDRLQGQFRDRSPSIKRDEWGCSVSFGVSAGWRAKLWGVSRYGVIMSVFPVKDERNRLHPDEPPGPYTRVLVALVDS